MNRNLYIIIFAGLLLLILVGCQGSPSENAPIHLNPNMDQQKRYDPQQSSGFFTDGRTMRQPVEGTVARGNLRIDEAYFTGMDQDGKKIKQNPEEINMDLLARGRERYNIFCSPCHGRVGDGKSIIMQYEYPIPPPTFHEQRIRDFADGYIFDVITNGVRNMPSYKHQVNVEDRWAIVAYVRALQRSQNAGRTDVPISVLNDLNE